MASRPMERDRRRRAWRLQHIEDNVPILREALAETRNDPPFIANLLLRAAPAVDMEVTEDMEGFLRSLARRA